MVICNSELQKENKLEEVEVIKHTHDTPDKWNTTKMKWMQEATVLLGVRPD